MASLGFTVGAFPDDLRRCGGSQEAIVGQVKHPIVDEVEEQEDQKQVNEDCGDQKDRR
jgi:hypothetical protein